MREINLTVTYLARFSIFTNGGLVGGCQFRRVVVHIQDSDAHGGLGCLSRVACRGQSRAETVSGLVA